MHHFVALHIQDPFFFFFRSFSFVIVLQYVLKNIHWNHFLELNFEC